MTYERPLFSLEAEQGVLGALMHKPELCEEIGAFLSAEHFNWEDHSTLYNLILVCKAKGERPDSVTLADKQPELPSGLLTLVYASELMRNVPSAANAKPYARTIVERHKARRMLAVSEEIATLAQTQGNLDDQIAQAQQMLFDLTGSDSKPDVINYNTALGEVFDRMQERLDGTANLGIEFGLPDLDDIVRGLRPGNLVVLAGRPGTGKTVMGTCLADKVAIKDRKGALIFSLEMSASELAERSLAAIAEVDKSLIESGEAYNDDMNRMRLEAAVPKMVGADVRICDRPGLTFSRLCNIARFQHRASPLALIVIDYLTLIRADPGARHRSKSEEVGSHTRGLKALAKELGIPVVVLAQLNRGVESRGDAKPKLTDLRDSGEIEQDADVVIIGYRDDSSPEGEMGITSWDVPKCRHASKGEARLVFIGPQQKFRPLTVYEMQRIEDRKREEAEKNQAKPARKSLLDRMT